MKIRYKFIILTAAFPIAMAVGGCQSTGGPGVSDSAEKFNFGGAVNDSNPLSDRVRSALKKSPETTTLRIKVSTLSEDSVKLSGFVSNDAIKHEAERIAGNVEGVRYVVNSLFVR